LEKISNALIEGVGAGFKPAPTQGDAATGRCPKYTGGILTDQAEGVKLFWNIGNLEILVLMPRAMANRKVDFPLAIFQLSP